MCNVTFPSSINTTGTATAGISTRDEDVAAENQLEAHLETRQASANFITVPPTILCSNQCSTTKSGCIAATYDLINGQCFFISNLRNSAIGSGISDTLVMSGKRIVAADGGSTSTSLAAAGPTIVSSRSASAYVYPATPTITTTKTPAPTLPLVSLLPTATTSDCGVLGLNCGPSQSSLTTQNCLLGIGLGGLLCAGPIPGMQTITIPTTSYTKTTAVIPVATVYTTSTVSYCSVGPNNFTSCSSLPKPKSTAVAPIVVTVTPIAAPSTKACVPGLLGIVTC